MDETEIELLAEAGTWVTHQPRSNMNNGVGVAPVEAMLRAGVNVGLGNDGFSNQMFAEIKNLNSFSNVEKAIQSEIDLQTVTIYRPACGQGKFHSTDIIGNVSELPFWGTDEHGLPGYFKLQKTNYL